MKKIIITIIACAFGVCAFAKTQSELVSEYSAIKANDERALIDAQRKFTADNKTDLLNLFNSWKATDDAKLSFDEVIEKYKSDADAYKQAYALRTIFARMYDLYYSEMEASDLVLCRLKSGYLKNAKSQSWYDGIKSAGFVVENVKLDARERFILAHQFGDKEYLLNIPASEGMLSPTVYLAFILPELVRMEDVSAAKEKCNEIESILIERGQLGAELTRVQAVSKALTARLVDAKILGK